MVVELSAAELEGCARVFVSLKTKDMAGAKAVLTAKYGNVKEEDGYLRVYDIEQPEELVGYLLEQGHVVSEIKKNKIGLEEYYIELMSNKEAN